MIVARAPASTANLGPGFDAAAAALDLWNTVELDEGPFSVDVEGEGAGELPRDATHLSLQAFALLAPVERYTFRFTNAIPLERGLGSSAAAIGLGLVAGAAAAGHVVAADELLTLGARLESHLDNLAAVVHGGVTVAWRDGGAPRARRIATDVPASPVAVVPRTRTSTGASRSAFRSQSSTPTQRRPRARRCSSAPRSQAATPTYSGTRSATGCMSRTARRERRSSRGFALAARRFPRRHAVRLRARASSSGQSVDAPTRSPTHCARRSAQTPQCLRSESRRAARRLSVSTGSSVRGRLTATRANA